MSDEENEEELRTRIVAIKKKRAEQLNLSLKLNKIFKESDLESATFELPLFVERLEEVLGSLLSSVYFQVTQITDGDFSMSKGDTRYENIFERFLEEHPLFPNDKRTTIKEWENAANIYDDVGIECEWLRKEQILSYHIILNLSEREE